ncbi:hypothetical protein [Epilithonimonas sp.]|uniref:hypothetical protein n=1 Tax=Epilithonimonas sp. TaxID=2894511 RepID=UPI0028B2100B|nr:hypothetical protein [Epilithonimonas sp.]
MKNYKNKIYKTMVRNIKISDSEAFKVLCTFYMSGGLDKPHLEFKQVKKGIFRCDYIENIQLEITDAIFYDERGKSRMGSYLHIVDLNTNTKVMSRFLKSCKEILFIDKKNDENSKEKSYQKNLKLEDFQYDSIDSDFYAPNNYTVLTNFYLSAKFKISEKEYFEFKFSFYHNSIIFMEPICTRFSVDDANIDELANLLHTFDQNYFEKYKVEFDLYGSPYLNFF